ncbi:Conserved hypothetical protein CHP02453 [Ruminiclostridium papyrosolvens DSM 2782]|uniref:TIGR02453 family protein n=1 Tax=Ruminiclostridium papyrosolvens DSM 2782 TaxID=588581 RepID=F1TCM7_9FIRM|nr:DUF2461 domain-containing protein [Ruminiclostridium papyrosolvens]EGD47744.1 Conserved hypothetical protein CHP02453 [Ruminiclostridium papyrosolvens DSM 2782]WES34461.1 DUF2461 domain-containing protein [Ruminiclostridium papyrosolvens DSM 2782]
MSFDGFTGEALRFLFENRMNNSKEWYDSHKPDYKKYVYNPFVELIGELVPTIMEIDSQIITIPSKLISRVRRDTRFTKDKTLYRDNVWLVFLRDKSTISTSPCFWFEISQKGSSYGVGYYGAETKSMANMREMIVSKHPLFLNALTCYESQNEFVIGGDLYKRSKFPDQPDNLKLWLDRKNIFFESVQDNFQLAFSKELPEVLKKGFLQLKPIYDFLCMVEAQF